MAYDIFDTKVSYEAGKLFALSASLLCANTCDETTTILKRISTSVSSLSVYNFLYIIIKNLHEYEEESIVNSDVEWINIDNLLLAIKNISKG